MSYTGRHRRETAYRAENLVASASIVLGSFAVAHEIHLEPGQATLLMTGAMLAKITYGAYNDIESHRQLQAVADEYRAAAPQLEAPPAPEAAPVVDSPQA